MVYIPRRRLFFSTAGSGPSRVQRTAVFGGSPLTVCPGCAISPASGGGISSRAAPFPKNGKGRGVWADLLHYKLEVFTMKRPLAYITAAWCGSDHENTKLAAQYCDGTILMPGESFSYNLGVGELTEERGFLPGPSYADGQSVMDMGGGYVRCHPPCTWRACMRISR